MSDQTAIRDLHQDNDTPTASDEGIARSDRDTPIHGEGSTGGSLENGVRADTKWADTGDPKSGGTPVHRAPSEESPRS